MLWAEPLRPLQQFQQGLDRAHTPETEELPPVVRALT